MRTQEQIVKRIDAIKDEDWLGFEQTDLIQCLDLAHAKPFLKDGVTEWEPESIERQAVIDRILDYMPFAWDKANNCRGISAGRSMYHMRAWLWLIDELDQFGDLLEYEFYGKPHLKAICEHFGWDWKQWDDGYWRNSESDNGITAEAATAG